MTESDNDDYIDDEFDEQSGNSNQELDFENDQINTIELMRETLNDKSSSSVRAKSGGGAQEHLLGGRESGKDGAGMITQGSNKKEASHHRNRNWKSNASQLSHFPQVASQSKNQKMMQRNSSTERNNSQNIIYTQDVFESGSKNRKNISLPDDLGKNLLSMTVQRNDSRTILASIAATSSTQQAIPIYSKQPSTKLLQQRMNKQNFLRPPNQYNTDAEQRRNGGASDERRKAQMPTINLKKAAQLAEQKQMKNYKTSRQNFPVTLNAQPQVLVQSSRQKVKLPSDGVSGIYQSGRRQHAQTLGSDSNSAFKKLNQTVAHGKESSAFLPKKGRSTSNAAHTIELSYETKQHMPIHKSTLVNNHSEYQSQTIGQQRKLGFQKKSFDPIDINIVAPSFEKQPSTNKFSTIPNKQRKGNHRNQKHVQEIQFVGAIHSAPAIYANKNRKLNPSHPAKQLTSPQKESTLLTNIDSFESLTPSVAACGQFKEEVKGLGTTIDKLQHELQIKDRLISKLIQDGGVAELDAYIDITESSKAAPKRVDALLKLKNELDLAYKILTDRDAEINTMKKQAKQQAFNQCNDERIMYMNESVKLHNLLKTNQSGSSNSMKLFKGVKVMKTTSSEVPSREETPKNNNNNSNGVEELLKRIKELEQANESKDFEANQLRSQCDDFKGELSKLHEARSEQSDKLEQLQQMCDQLEVLPKRISQRDEKIRTLKRTMKQLKEEHDQALIARDEKVQDMAKTKDAFQIQRDEEFEQLRAKYTQQIEELTSEHQAELLAQRQKSKQKLEQVLADQSSGINHDNEHELLLKEKQDEIDDLKKAHEEALRVQRQKHEQDLQNALIEQNTNLNHDHEAALEALELKHESLIEEKQQEIDQHEHPVPSDQQAAHEVKLMTEMIRTLEEQAQTEQARASDQLASKQAQNQALQAQVTNLEAQLADQNSKSAQNDTASVQESKNVKQVVEKQPDDSGSFADLIAKQGTLVEQLKLEKLRAQRLQERIQEQEKEQSEESALYYDDIPDEEVTLEPTDTIKSIEEKIPQVIDENDQELLHELRAVQRVLLKHEITRIQQSLVKKNQLLNETLESQEQLAQNAIQQRQQVEETKEQVMQAVRQIEELEAKVQTKDSKIINLSAGLTDLVRVTLQKQFLTHKLSDRKNLELILANEPEKVLQDRFMLPKSTQKLLDCSATGLFDLVDTEKLQEAQVAAANQEENNAKLQEDAQEQKRLEEEELAEKVRLREEEEQRQREMQLAQLREQELGEEKARLQAAEEARQRELKLSEETKLKEQQLEEAGRLQKLQHDEMVSETLRQQQEELEQKTQQLAAKEEEGTTMQDYSGECEGFSVATYLLIKHDKDLAMIVSIANAILYKLRNECSIYNVNVRHLMDNKQVVEPKPFSSLTDTFEGDIEVITNQDFFEVVLKAGIGLKEYVEVAAETQKLQTLLGQIGAIAQPSSGNTTIELVRLEVLMAAMRVHGYEFAGSSHLDGSSYNLRELSPKSVRIMNRLARIIQTYQAKYQQKAKEGSKVSLQQIINAVFRGKIETRILTTEGGKSMSPTNTSEAPSVDDRKVQLLSKSNFYATLFKLKVRKSAIECTNLSRFLIDESYASIPVKDLLSIVTEFLRSPYLKTFGFNKRHLTVLFQQTQVAEDEAEYYYDEEEDDNENNGHATTKPIAQGPAMPEPKLQQSDAEEEEEYYDEEADDQQQQQEPLLPNPSQMHSNVRRNSEQPGDIVRPSPVRPHLQMTPSATHMMPFKQSNAQSVISGYQADPSAISSYTNQQAGGSYSHAIPTEEDKEDL